LRVGTGIVSPSGVCWIVSSDFITPRPYSVIPRPSGVSAKVARAEHHFRRLDAVITSYVERSPYVPESKGTDKGNTRMVDTYVRLHEPVPEILPLVVGDFLHNLRSSLDHLARGLVETQGNRPSDNPPYATAFPIHRDPPGRGRAQITGGVHPRALAIVESLQPYNAPNGNSREHPLYVLNHLSNIDKHRTLHLPVVALAGAEMTFRVGREGRIMRASPTSPGPYHDGAHIGSLARIVVSDEGSEAAADTISPEEEPEVAMYAHLVPVVTLGEVRPDPSETVSLQSRLNSLLQFVRDEVLPMFDPFFEWSTTGHN
jgi:hypothetical protein